MLPFKNPLFEVMSAIHQQGAYQFDRRRFPCSDLELNAYECLEAYGLSKGYFMCHKYLDDLDECKHKYVTFYRNRIIREERYRKILNGEIKWKDRMGAPYNYDSFIYGTFTP